MKKIMAVIGANFGDEGKGLMTDYLANENRENAIVVRSNGGAQAGHTVTMPDGRRHVFGHFSAGTFAGLPGFLSEYFVLNPMLFMKELRTLRDLGEWMEIYADKQCMVTTPYDMIINQIAEQWRGADKHGSCGVGFNETITRCLASDEFKLTLADLADTELTRRKLTAIREKYVSKRLKMLGIHEIPARFTELLAGDALMEGFLFNVAQMLKVMKVSDIWLLKNYDTIIFEGAQGLMLDEDHPYFPHVTRSHTGIHNVVAMMAKLGCKEEMLEVVYTTRAYLTRHGAGPFPTELSYKPYPRIEDMTNVPNPYQDTLRYGLVNINELVRNIRNDLEHAVKHHIQCRVAISVTCLDQLDGEVRCFLDGVEQNMQVNDFVREICFRTNAFKAFTVYGPTRGDCSRIALRTVSKWYDKVTKIARYA